MVSSAMLMAAGLGTRLRPFTNVATKAMLPVLGVPIAQFALDSLLSSGVDSVVANVHHDAERTRSGLLSLDHTNAQLIISDESQLLLGSGGGIRKALPHFGSKPFFLANADVLCDVNWRALAAAHQRLRAMWGVHLTLTVFPAGPSGTAYREIHFDAQTKLITGLGSPSVGRPYFVGAAVLEREAFLHTPEEGPAEFVPNILDPAIRARKAGVFLSTGSWYDIGSPSLWLNLHLSLLKRLEVGHFPSSSSKAWKRRWEEVNFRLGERLWVSKESLRSSHRVRWAAPSYWDGRGVERTEIPEILGPEAILYGSPRTKQETYKSGIGFGGEWFSASKRDELYSG